MGKALYYLPLWLFLAILAGLFMVAVACSNAGKLTECKRVAIDAYHYPEEYRPGAANWHRANGLGIQPQHIGTVGPAQADCEKRWGADDSD